MTFFELSILIFLKKKIPMKNNLAVHMRYHLFLHYGWFLQNLGKDFIPSTMHTTIVYTGGKKGCGFQCEM